MFYTQNLFDTVTPPITSIFLDDYMTDTPIKNDILETVFGIHEDKAIDENWNAELAEARAKELNIDLKNTHWEVIHYLRQFYQKYGQVTHARQLTNALQNNFVEQGGLKYLYTLFPDGPVAQGCYIAGLLPPADSANPSFGSTM